MAALLPQTAAAEAKSARKAVEEAAKQAAKKLEQSPDDPAAKLASTEAAQKVAEALLIFNQQAEAAQKEALEAANKNDLKPMNNLLSILKKPYTKQSNIENFQVPSNNQNYQTFCGT